MNKHIPKKISRLAQYLESRENISDKELLYAIRSLNVKLSDIGDYVNFKIIVLKLKTIP